MFPESPSNASGSEERSEVSVEETNFNNHKVAKKKNLARKSTVAVKKADLAKINDEESALEKLPVEEKEIDNVNKAEPG